MIEKLIGNDCHENCMSIKKCLLGYICIYNIVIYLAYVIDTKKEKPSLSNIPIVCDYPYMFQENLPGLTP